MHPARFLGLFAACLAGVLAGAAARAQEKTADLTKLQDAVASASKRGDNVVEVSRALDELAKAVAQGATEVKERAKEELVALRAAVEQAGRKGEDVAEIRKELAAIEIALTGKAYERPRETPRVDPVFPVEPTYGRRGVVRDIDGNVIIRGGRGIVIQGVELGGRRGGNSTAITINGAEFSIRALNDGVQYLIEGTIDEDGQQVRKVTITDGIGRRSNTRPSRKCRKHTNPRSRSSSKASVAADLQRGRSALTPSRTPRRRPVRGSRG